jgi:membrane-bound metal-dependent hydrolase YbcI (DUF457 family)
MEKMPITPLHFGLLPVLNRIIKVKPSAWAFVLPNVLTDIPVVLRVQAQMVADLGGPPLIGTLHSGLEHTLAGSVVLGLCVGVLGFKSARWWLGGLLGAVTHVLLDMVVHHDVAPFGPWSKSNPFYIDGAHGVLSIVLLIGLVVWVLELWDARRSMTGIRKAKIEAI